MRFPGQIEILRAPEGQPGGGGDSGSAASVGGGTSAAPSSTGSTDTSVSSAPSGTPSVAPSPSSVPSSAPPASTPQSALPPSADADDGTPTDVFDFSSLLNGQFENGDITTPPAPVAASTPAPVAPAPPPVATPAAQPAAPATPAPAAAVTGQQAPLSLAEPGRLADAMASQEAAIVEEAARTMFALSPEEITGLEENAVAIIPKLLSRVYVQAQHSMLTTLQRALPAMLGTHLTQKQTHDANEGKFYEKWKAAGVDRAQHGPLVTRMATMYRRMNPGATFDQMVDDLGPMVVMAAKIQPPAPSAAPHQGNGFTRPPPQPFVPAGGGPGVMSNQAQGDPWEILDPNRAE